MSELDWVLIASTGDLPEGRVKSVTARTKNLCLAHFDGQWAAMDNHCPHQGGPLGEGSIERGDQGQCWIRCPWHGWDFDPLTGKPPGGHADTGQTVYPLRIDGTEIHVGIPVEPPAQRTISDEMVETMRNWGVVRVFGMVGHSNLGLAEAVRLQVEEGTMSYLGIRHEGAAAFAASAYGKLTGRAAACLTIAGPGATNLLTGLWDAKVDRAPVLALTGQVQTQVFGPGAFQDIDLRSAFDAVTQFSQTVLPTSKPAELMSLACKSALVEQNIAHLIFPDDVQTLPSEVSAQAPAGRLSRTGIRPDQADLDAAIKKISAAKRPLIVAGFGAWQCPNEILALAERLGAPVATTFKAKGVIADTHPLAAGVMGRSGTPVASWFMNESDLIIALGASFSNHTGIDPKKPIIQVDSERMQLAKFHPVDLPIWSDLSEFCKALPNTLTNQDRLEQMRLELLDRWKIWRDEKATRRTETQGRGVASANLFDALTACIPSNAIIAVDVGNNTYSFGRYFESRGQRVLMSGYLGSIGFSLPAAIGALAATEDWPEFTGRPVISISGDGGFGQYAMEWTTAVKYQLNITHVLLHNKELGKISKEQRAGEWNVWETELSNPSFAKFSELCGGWGQTVEHMDQFDAVFAEALSYPGPALVEVMTDADLI